MEFSLVTRTPHCMVENRPHTHWMRYIVEGFRVCVACEPPALRNNSSSCQGDGQDSDKYEVRNLLPVEVCDCCMCYVQGLNPKCIYINCIYLRVCVILQ